MVDGHRERKEVRTSQTLCLAGGRERCNPWTMTKQGMLYSFITPTSSPEGPSSFISTQIAWIKTSLQKQTPSRSGGRSCFSTWYLPLASRRRSSRTSRSMRKVRAGPPRMERQRRRWLREHAPLCICMIKPWITFTSNWSMIAIQRKNQKLRPLNKFSGYV